jgi:hypothetical protein
MCMCVLFLPSWIAVTVAYNLYFFKLTWLSHSLITLILRCLDRHVAISSVPHDASHLGLVRGVGQSYNRVSEALLV